MRHNNAMVLNYAQNETSIIRLGKVKTEENKQLCPKDIYTYICMYTINFNLIVSQTYSNLSKNNIE